MAGRGPSPKPSSTRVRRNGGASMADRVVLITPAGQPKIPAQPPGVDDNGKPLKWPNETRTWWKMWAEHPLAAEFTASDWSFLKDTAVLHGRYWSGDVTVAAELRIRVAKFGATPEDRARLRVQFAVAEKSEVEARRAATTKKAAAKKIAARRKAGDPRAYLTAVSDD